MKGNGTDMSAAEATKLRVYRVLGHGGITQMAEDLGEHRSWISAVLNGKATSAPMLEKINAYLDKIEAEKSTIDPAA